MCKNLDGENLANFWSVVNFAKFLQHQSFPPYGSSQPLAIFWPTFTIWLSKSKFTRPNLLYISNGEKSLIVYNNVPAFKGSPTNFKFQVLTPQSAQYIRIFSKVNKMTVILVKGPKVTSIYLCTVIYHIWGYFHASIFSRIQIECPRLNFHEPMHFYQYSYNISTTFHEFSFTDPK